MVSYEMAHFSSSNTHAQRDRQIDKKKEKKERENAEEFEPVKSIAHLDTLKG